MNSSEEKNAMDFWYEYDNFFLFSSPDDITEAMLKVDPYGKMLDLFYFCARKGSVDTEFKNSMQRISQAIII